MYNERRQENKKKYAYAKICDPDTFSLFYKLEKRRLKREWISVFLVHLGLLNNKVNNKEIVADNHMKNVLKSNLRCGDVVCEWSNKNFLIMLMNIQKQEVNKVIKRIKNKFQDKFENNTKIKLYHDFHKM